MFRTVGERPTVKTNRYVGETQKSWYKRAIDWLTGRPITSTGQARMVGSQKNIWLKLDVPLLAIVIALIIFGLVVLASASYDVAYRVKDNTSYYFTHQLLWLAIGFIFFLAFFLIDYHRHEVLALPLMIFTLVLLIASLVVSLSGIGGVRALFANSGQPSELAKFVVIIYLAVWLHSRRDNLKSFSFGFLPVAIIIGLVAALIFLQPDYSAVATVLTIGGIMFFIAGGNIGHILLFLTTTTLFGYLIVGFTGRGLDRVTGFVEGIKSPINGPDQVVNSLTAFVEGGWLGVGLGNSQTKLVYLQVPHTDGIFAVVGAELGAIVAIITIITFTILLWRGIRIAQHAQDSLGVLLAGGVALWIAIEAFLNMAVSVGLFPVIGNALPFISYGGSSLVTTMAAIGLLMNVARYSIEIKEEKGTFFDAVVNLRGRNGGRGVSRIGRSASHRK